VSDSITIQLARDEATLLYAQLRDLADTTLDEADDQHDRRIGHTLDHIADLVHDALREA